MSTCHKRTFCANSYMYYHIVPFHLLVAPSFLFSRVIYFDDIQLGYCTLTGALKLVGCEHFLTFSRDDCSGVAGPFQDVTRTGHWSFWNAAFTTQVFLLRSERWRPWSNPAEPALCSGTYVTLMELLLHRSNYCILSINSNCFVIQNWRFSELIFLI